jgi:phosphatidylglycerol:prolipoprotein diacylglycerol transferase
VRPILLELGPLKIHAYGFALALSFLIGSLWVTRRGRRWGFREDDLSRLFLYLLGAALIGSRVYYGFQHPEDFRDDWLELFRVWQGGLTQHGGILACLLTGWLYARSRRWRFTDLADLAAPAIALGEGITRVGCFLAGCCHGAPTSWFWAVCYPEGAAARWLFGDACVHPSQLLLSGGNLLLFLLLAKTQPRWFGTGRVLALYLGFSSLLRLAVDFTRYYAPSDRIAILGLRLAHSQWLAIVLALVAVLLWALPRSARRAGGAPLGSP